MEATKGVWVNQDLTRTRAKIAAEARKLVKCGRAKSTFTWDGKIFVVDNSDRKHKVLTMETLISLYGQLGAPPEPPTNANNNG